MPAGREISRAGDRDIDGVAALVMIGSVTVKSAVDLDDEWIGPALHKQRPRRVCVCVPVAAIWGSRYC